MTPTPDTTSRYGDGPNTENLAGIEKTMFIGNSQYLKWHKKLSAVPVEKRAAILREFAQSTKWGTEERFIACYMCAWYGVDYTRTRDYLRNVTFWFYWKNGPQMTDKAGDEFPFSFDDVSIDCLYALYEHNHDFQLLHDIITTQADAGTETAIIGFTAEAISDHPRGILHVAGISPKGWRFVYSLVHNEASPDMELGYTGAELKPYFKKVAADRTDPLAPIAQDLLKTHPKHNHHN